MGTMYDAIDLTKVPADATEILAYTDGLYTNLDQAGQLFPNARIQTISCLGTTPADWLDVEEGCIWPPATAVPIWAAWKTAGCRGFYGTAAVLDQVKQAMFAPGFMPAEAEWFNADWTNTPHITPGYTQTQYASLINYDVTMTPDTTPELPGGNDVQLIIDGQGRLNVVGQATDNGNLLVFTEVNGKWGVIDVTDQLGTGPGHPDPRIYRIT